MNKNPEEENEMVQDLEDVKELGKEMEQISEQNDEAFEEKKSEQESLFFFVYSNYLTTESLNRFLYTI